MDSSHCSIDFEVPMINLLSSTTSTANSVPMTALSSWKNQRCSGSRRVGEVGFILFRIWCSLNHEFYCDRFLFVRRKLHFVFTQSKWRWGGGGGRGVIAVKFFDANIVIIGNFVLNAKRSYD